MSARTRVLTGITTTGTPHLGNYVGAIRPALRLAAQPDTDAFFFLADYHALIKCDDPERIARSRLEIAATWLACGLDPARVTFYRQSDIPEIPELTWLLTCVTAKGLMNRAHAYKAAVDANTAQGEDADAGIGMGLYSYPVLMAADILLFGAQQVPVGRDQVQHIEMARDIAQRFNHLYGGGKALLALPDAVVDEDVATLPGLDGRKMSKSYDNTIPLFAGGSRALEDAIARIVTDSRRPGEPKDPDSNALCAIYRAFATRAEGDAFAADLRAGLAWGEAKQRLAARIEAEIGPKRARYDQMTVTNYPEEALREGAEKARMLAIPLLAELRHAVGLRAPQAGSAQVMRGNASVRVGRFVTFRGKDGHFHFRFLGADGADLLLSVPFDTPKAAADWVQVLDKAGGAARFVWGPDSLHLRATEHVGGHAFELWFARERLAEAGPHAEAAARDAAMLHLVDALETRWRALAAAQP
ncbi:tryptophan--tRNA ligase [Metallibacterium sp.]|uniref:tryptophan--tRNA ligase n=1 Tax=Metallibacterium sp. TaxID=2940281 RepID=UPI00261C6965|nr:tryptophan--tRNA ligase [Metallibacterium sp.]